MPHTRFIHGFSLTSYADGDPVKSRSEPPHVVLRRMGTSSDISVWTPDEMHAFADAAHEAADQASGDKTPAGGSVRVVARPHGRWVNTLSPGLYRLHKSDGTTILAAVGLLHDGERWYVSAERLTDIRPVVNTDWTDIEGATAVELTP